MDFAVYGGFGLRDKVWRKCESVEPKDNHVVGRCWIESSKGLDHVASGGE
jgi:hypothetical protein